MRRPPGTAALALLIAAASAAIAQAPPEGTDRILNAAREVMAAAQFCFLITLDGSAQPQARLMEPFPPEEDFRVWMGTNPASRKVGQIRSNPRATLAYHDSKGPGYVTLVGRIRLATDLSERRRRWRADWETHFPGGPEGANFVALEFTPDRIELISIRHGVTPAAGSTRPVILERRGARWEAVPAN